MEFKFNFNVGDETSSHESTEDTSISGEIQLARRENSKPDIPAVKRYDVADIVKRWSAKDSVAIFAIDEVNIPGQEASLYAATPSYPDANTTDNTNDLISSVYEGGFKIWECTMDLIEHLQGSKEWECMKSKTVIDIGCGVGLLGVYAMEFCQASSVTFQDFNENVILDATGPTALMNFNLKPSGEKVPSNVQNDDACGEQTDRPQDVTTEVYTSMQNFLNNSKLVKNASSKINFLAGDWSELLKAETDIANHTQYDVVLSSETIYNESNYTALHNYLNAVTKCDSVIYMSAKSHYFGVGGGVHSWIVFVNRNRVFAVDIVKDIDTNLKRHILRLKRK